VLVGFGDFVDIAASDFWYLFGPFARPSWLLLIVSNWLVAGDASSVLTGDAA
jgi:hypothetical protein